MLKLIKRILDYKLSKNLTYFWNWGSLMMLCLVIQIITGLILATWYVPEVNEAFDVVTEIIKEVQGGWGIRFTHMNVASVYFFGLYVHLARGLYYASYLFPRHNVWFLGSILFVLSIATAFFGYSLPWTAMAYWAATVILSLLSTIPLWGPQVVEFVWGGFSLGQPTITRIFSLHYLLPFVILAIVGWHLYELHRARSSDYLGEFSEIERVEFTPTYTVKDLLGVIAVLGVIGIAIYYNPNLLTHPLNYAAADPLVTPPHIVPEWYFLPFYGILRSIPDKGWGVFALCWSILLLVFLPFIARSEIRNTKYRIIYKFYVVLFFIDVIALGWAAAHPAEGFYLILGRVCTAGYFLFFIGLPACEKLEMRLVRYFKNRS